MIRSGLIVALVLATACQTSTTRPTFGPMPGAAGAQVRLGVPDATRLLAETLQEDSIPVSRVVERDGLIETAWFEVPGYRPFPGRPLGPTVVRVRAWVDPGKAGHSVYTAETVYRVMADPSRPDRELERQVPEDHQVSTVVAEAVRKLLYRFGDPDDIKADSTARAAARRTQPQPQAPADTAGSQAR